MEVDEPIEPTIAEVADSVVDPPIEQTPRRSIRVRTEPVRYGFLIDDDQNITLIEDDEPESYDEVLKSSERDLWLKAKKSEMDSMSKNKVCVTPPDDPNLTPSGDATCIFINFLLIFIFTQYFILFL